MSLTITSTFNTAEGFEVTNAYARVAVVDQPAGVELTQLAEVYLTEQDFLDNKLQLQPVGFTSQSTAPYDRAVDGTDILDLAHDNLIAHYASQGIVAVKNL